MTLVNRIKFIARLNEFQMNDDGVKSMVLSSSVSGQIERNITSILQLLPSQFNSISFMGSFLIYEID